jgi:hypothetical protein
MSTTTSKSEYLLLFRGSPYDRASSPQQLQDVLGKFMGWFERLSQEGTLKAGQPLSGEGRTVSGKNGSTVADGPFAESKEAVGGYFIVYADSLDEAVRIAKECPTLGSGVAVEVRPIAAECPAMQHLRGQNAAELEAVGA